MDLFPPTSYLPGVDVLTPDTGLPRLLLATAFGVGASILVLSINGSTLTPGMHADGVQYLAAAESFAERGTFTTPASSWRTPGSPASLSHFPPGFPVLVSIPVRLGVPPINAALWIMAASAGIALAFAFLLGTLVAGVPGGAVAAFLLVCTPALTRMHLAVWSEPSYLAVTLPLLYVMARHPRRAGVQGLLAAIGLGIRYVGAAGTALAVLWALLQGRSRLERARGAALAAAPSALLAAWWLVHTSTADGTVRQMGWYVAGLGRNLARLDDLATDWLVAPTVGGGSLMAAALVAAVGAVVWSAWRDGVWRPVEAARAARASLLYVACYGVVLLGSRMFLDPGIPFDFRIFSPTLVLATICIAASVVEVARKRGGHVAGAIGIVVGAWAGMNWVQIRATVRAVNENGLYFTHRAWITGSLIGWVRDAPADLEPIYSNEPELLHFLTGRRTTDLPRDSERADFDEFRASFLASPGPVVLTYPVHDDDMAEATLAEALPLRPVLRTNLGVVYLPTSDD